MQTWQNKDRAERTGRLFNLLCFYFVQVRTPPQAIGRGECVYESFVPGENLTRGSSRNQLRRGHGSPPVLSEVPHELSTAARSKECKRSPQHSFRPDSPSRHPSTGDGRLSQPPPPHRTWSVPDASSQPQLNLSNSVLSELLHFA